MTTPTSNLPNRVGAAVTRRALLRSAAAAGGVALLAGCGDGAPPTPTAVAPTAPAPAVAEPSVTGGLDLTALPATPAATPVAAAPAAPAAEGTPAATGQARLDQLMAVSAALVGGGQLDPDRGAQFLRLADADPARTAALDRLLASPPDPATAAPALLAYPWETAAAIPPAATPLAAPAAGSDAAKELLRFWYLGTVDGAAVEGRDHAWFSLGAWQALRYTAAPSVCKAFGSWATAPAQPA